jgi:hypothetical protein
MKFIEFSTTTFSDAEEKKLREHIGAKSDTLRSVVRSKVREHLIEASNTAMTIESTNAFSEKAQAQLNRAKRYQTFLEVLEELVEQKEAFSVIVLK